MSVGNMHAHLILQDKKMPDWMMINIYVFVQAYTHDISETYHIRFIFYFYCCCHCFVVKRDMKFKCNDITLC